MSRLHRAMPNYNAHVCPMYYIMCPTYSGCSNMTHENHSTAICGGEGGGDCDVGVGVGVGIGVGVGVGVGVRVESSLEWANGLLTAHAQVCDPTDIR